MNAKHLRLNAWRQYVDSLDFDPLFVTVSGAHLYGFPSEDSDVDLRSCHQLPLRDLVGLDLPNQTIDRSTVVEGIEVDIVSHDVGKYLGLLVKNNGYVLEQIFSPIVIAGQSFLDVLRPIAKRCIVRHHYHHYRGFYATQRKLIEKQESKKAKTILYAYRVLMTGIHLMETGEVEANLVNLNVDFQLDFIGALIEMKSSEHVAPENLDWDFHATRLDRLAQRLDVSFEESKLGECRDRAAVNQLLVELRLSDRKG